MRKMLLVLSLAGLTVFAGAGDAFAQFRVNIGGWGSPGISIGRGGYYGSNGYYGNSYYGNRGYSPYYQNYGYGNAYQYGPGYYNSAPSYSVDPYYSQPLIRQAYYPAPASVQQSANVTVLVPAADAQVWFENRATTQQGMERLFHSPPLDPNHNFTYTIKVRWMENGQAVIRERQVNVQAGQSVTVNFRESVRQDAPIPPPLPRLPTAIPRE